MSITSKAMMTAVILLGASFYAAGGRAQAPGNAGIVQPPFNQAPAGPQPLSIADASDN